ncbi:MAG TPA: ABC-type transport auxiliary lipoprotein family protein [Kofleriaceae bacterium]|nr:ABC-type transport auxiliary lipoprotein family protein [Kofleriaceae bacterium]
MTTDTLPRPAPLRDRLFIAGVFLFVALSIVAAFAGCAGRTPPTRYYDLATPPVARADQAAAVAPAVEPMLAIDQLATDDAYDDERIVYRASPYRLDYYDYHRWSAPPGVMIANYLERALERSGRFGAVLREPTRDTPLVLTGRVAAIEEVDVSRTAWKGHLVLELRLVDNRTGDTVWSHQYDESQPLARQSPEGLAEAITAAMARIVRRAGPEISAQLADHVADRNGP